jgi:N-acetylglucosamine kinase-like BadF-type ATPase
MKGGSAMMERWQQLLQKTLEDANRRWARIYARPEAALPPVEEAVNTVASLIEEAADRAGIEIADARALALAHPADSAAAWCELHVRGSRYAALQSALYIVEDAYKYWLQGLTSRELETREPEEFLSDLARRMTV